MLKKLTVFVVLLSLILSVVPVSAAHYSPNSSRYIASESVRPIVFEKTIRVTENGGVYSIGFADVVFKKGFLDDDKLPITFRVRISAVNGVAGIEFQPDVADFCRDVIIRVDAYKGFLYDDTSGKNIFVNVKKQQIRVGHFSRYAFS